MEPTRWQRLRSRSIITLARLTRGMTLGARVMCIDEGRVLLIRHTYVPGWQLPGGGVDADETAEEAAGRELREETGYRFAARPQLFGFYYNGRVHARDHIALYLSRAQEIEVPFAPNREIAECAWFAKSDLPPETTGGTRRRIAEVFGGGPPDERW